MIASLKKSSAKEEAEGGASVLFPQINPLILIAAGDRHSMCSEIAVDLLTDCREGEIAPERKREPTCATQTQWAALTLKKSANALKM